MCKSKWNLRLLNESFPWTSRSRVHSKFGFLVVLTNEPQFVLITLIRIIKLKLSKLNQSANKCIHLLLTLWLLQTLALYFLKFCLIFVGFLANFSKRYIKTSLGSFLIRNQRFECMYKLKLKYWTNSIRGPFKNNSREL